MTTKFMPDFYGSPYLIVDEKGWRLKDGAPEELKKEFEEFMKDINDPRDEST